MFKRSSFFPVLCMLLVAMMLGACSPKFNWREVRNTEERFIVMFPDKPASFSRPVNIDGTTVTMTMTAAEIDGVTFAVGSATLPNAGKTAQTLEAMKTALVRNINGTIQKEATSASPPRIEVEALGTPASHPAKQPMLLMARLVANEAHLYQVLVVGPEKKFAREEAETFFASFKPL